jgi:hypothetical protein
MNEGNVGVVLAILLAIGGVAYLRPAVPDGGAHADAPSVVATPAPARCALDAPCAAAEYFDGSGASADDVWARHCPHMTHLIALVPDPVAAHIGWMFDPLVESIQRAVEADHYSFDRFAFPWDAGAAEKAACDRKDGADASTCGPHPPHESLPGVLLFRKSDWARANAPSAAPATDDVLAIYLVGETPTGGVHKRALESAMTRVAACSTAPLKILGPTFSGSARSLRIALSDWWAANAPWAAANLDAHAQQDAAAAGPLEAPIQLISGTATGVPIDELTAVGHDGGAGPPVVSFQTTVLPDSYTYARFVDGYLRGELGVQPSDIALLVEANSAYGQHLGRDGATRDEGSVLTLPFPMHIGAVRSAAIKAHADTPETGPVPGVARPDLTMALDDDAQPLDLPPQIHPHITLPAEEFALANVLATIARKGIRYVGIVASDSRDKVFLAKQVHKYCQDVRLFTFESDLVFTHPDNRAALVGMLVASTYPLFNRTQAWTTIPDAPRLQFPNSAAQGVYNAVLALLGHGGEWLMADYAAPQDWNKRGADTGARAVRQQPLLWISTVGNLGLWPLAVYDPSALPTDDATRAGLDRVWLRERPVGETTLRRHDDIESGAARSALIGWMLLTVFALSQAARYFAANRPNLPAWADAIANPAYQIDPAHRGEQLAYVLVGFAALAIVYAQWSWPFVAMPGAVPFGAAQPIVAFTVAMLLTVLLDAAATAAALPAAAWPVLAELPRWATRAVSVAAVALLIALALRARAENASELASAARLLDFERFTSLESQLSPLVPCLFVAAAWLAWVHGQLRRLLLIAQVPPMVVPAAGARAAGVSVAERAIDAAIAAPWRRGSIVFVAAMSLAASAFVYHQCLPTFEGRAFDGCFIPAFFLASLAVACAFAHAFLLWSRTRALLDRLVTHPLAAAFARRPPRLLTRLRDSLYAYEPTLVDLEYDVGALRDLCAGAGQVCGRLERDLGRSCAAVVDALTGWCAAAESQIARAAAAESRRGLRDAMGAARARLVGAAATLATDVLAPRWDAGSTGGDTAADAWIAAAEDFVVGQVLAYIGYLFLHIRNLLASATVALVCLLLAVPSYPFEPQHLLNLFVGALVLLAVVAVLVALAQMNRSELLSTLTDSVLKFDRTLFSPLLKFGALPLISLIATQFPVIGDTIFSWVGPALRAVK